MSMETQKAESGQRVDKNTLIGIPPMSLACYASECSHCKNTLTCQCLHHPPIHTQARFDAACAAAYAAGRDEAVEGIRERVADIDLAWKTPFEVQRDALHTIDGWKGKGE